MASPNWRSILPVCALVLGSLVACDSFDEENDIWVTNASDCWLAKVTLDGHDRGDIERGETRKFDDVANGVHELAAYRHEEDEEPCDTFVTDYLSGDEDDYWVIDCSCN